MSKRQPVRSSQTAMATLPEPHEAGRTRAAAWPTALRRITILGLGWIVLAGLAGCQNGPQPAASQPEAGPATPKPVDAHGEDPSQQQTLEAGIRMAGEYLIASAHPNGLFLYRVNTDPFVRIMPRYNILRHAGAVYALSMYYDHTDDSDALAPIQRGAAYLRDSAMRPLSDEENVAAIWSLPEVNRTGNPLQAKLGATGIGLLAIVRAMQYEPALLSRDELEQLGDFIIYMQKADGDFYFKYVPSAGGRQDDWRSLYYPGEAALGLVMLHEQKASPRHFAAAVKTLDYLAKRRKDKQHVPADHWALLATARILAAPPVESVPVPRERLLDHAAQICTSILSTQVARPDAPQYDGGFDTQGRTCPTATRLEGLLAARNALPPDHELIQKIDDATERGIAFLLRAQIKDGPHKGGFTRATALLPEHVPGASSFNRRATEIRVDYVQHALCAMIQYRQMKHTR